MCGSMVDIECAAAEIRRGKKKEDKKKSQDENIMVCPITYGDLNYPVYSDCQKHSHSHIQLLLSCVTMQAKLFLPMPVLNNTIRIITTYLHSNTLVHLLQKMVTAVRRSRRDWEQQEEQ